MTGALFTCTLMVLLVWSAAPAALPLALIVSAVILHDAYSNP